MDWEDETTQRTNFFQLCHISSWTGDPAWEWEIIFVANSDGLGGCRVNLIPPPPPPPLRLRKPFTPPKGASVHNVGASLGPSGAVKQSPLRRALWVPPPSPSPPLMVGVTGKQSPLGRALWVPPPPSPSPLLRVGVVMWEVLGLGTLMDVFDPSCQGGKWSVHLMDTPPPPPLPPCRASIDGISLRTAGVYAHSLEASLGHHAPSLEVSGRNSKTYVLGKLLALALERVIRAGLLSQDPLQVGPMDGNTARLGFETHLNPFKCAKMAQSVASLVREYVEGLLGNPCCSPHWLQVSQVNAQHDQSSSLNWHGADSGVLRLAPRVVGNFSLSQDTE